MSKIRYVKANADGPNTVSWSGGVFNIGAALQSGGGAFTVDDQTQASLVQALDQVPNVQRAGGEGSTGGGVAQLSSVVLPWQPGIPYKAGQMMIQSGVTYYRNADGISRTTFDATEITAWTALGRNELAYAEITAGVSGISSTSYADIAGLAVTFTAPSTPVDLTLYAPQVDNGTAGQSVVMQILQLPSTQIAESFHASTSSLASSPFVLRRRMRGLAVGTSYTFKAQVRVTGGSGEIQPRGGAPIFLAADQV